MTMNWIVLVTVFVATFVVDAVVAQGHWEDYQYQVTSLERQCRSYNYKSCRSYVWGLIRRCSTHTRTQCNNVPVTRTRTARRCQAGWQPPSCTTAICTPPCRNGQVCKAPPQTCECISSGGGACTHVPCSSTRNCYPGTCSSSGNTCSCPSGFSGSNCETMNLKPTLSDCRARIYDGGRVVAENNCSAEGIDPLPVWLSTASPSRIQVSYRADFTADRTPRVDYVENSPVPLGITLATFLVSLPSTTHHVSPSHRCVNNVWELPQTSKPCNMDVLWTDIGIGDLQHNSTFNVTAQSQSGGQKIGNSDVTGGNFRATDLVGLKTERLMKFSVDLKPPTHCLLQPSNTADNCTCFPIYLEQDVTTNAVIEPLLCGWTDDASDIDRYHVEVYYMNVGGNGELEETRTPLHTEDIRPPHYSLRFTCKTSGVHSIQLTVYDRANNSARARQLFNYDGISKMTINDVPIYVEEAHESTGRKWINALPRPRDSANYSLNVVWKGRYKSDARYADTWLKAAKPWAPGNLPCTSTNNCVDDNHGYSFGLRSVDRVDNITGIVGYSVGFVVDSAGGIGLSAPPEYITVPPTQERVVISIPKKKKVPTATLR